MLEAKHNERIGNTMTYSEELLSFIHRSPSIYHVIENLRAGLAEHLAEAYLARRLPRLIEAHRAHFKMSKPTCATVDGCVCFWQDRRACKNKL